jgi:hypothetical protein
MTLELGGNLVGGLACPAFDNHPSMELPIGWRMMASGQFAYLVLLLFILRRSCLYTLRHGSSPSPVTFSSFMIPPLRNRAIAEVATIREAAVVPRQP